MRQTLTRTRAFAAATIGLALALSGCGGTPQPSPGSSDPASKTTITFSYLWGGDEGKAIEGLIAKYNASQDKTEVKGVSAPDMTKQVTAMASKTGSFDVSDNFGNGVGSWAQKGVIEPLDDLLIKAGGSADDFIPSAMSQMKYQGKIYSLPIAVHTFQLYYNKKMLADAGIKPPTTLVELASANDKLTKKDAAGNITQMGLGNPDAATTLTTLGYAMGGTWDGGDAANPVPSPTSAGNVAALKWWTDNITGKYGPEAVKKFAAGWGEYMSAQDPFYTGKVAMIIDGEWQAVNIPKKAMGLDVGVVPIPVDDPARVGTTQLTASTLFIPANSAHKAEAAAFLKWITDGPQMLSFAKALGNLPARTSLASAKDFDSIPSFDTFMKSLASPNLHALSSAPYSAQYATDLGSAFESVLSGKAAPDAALAKVAEQAKSYSK